MTNKITQALNTSLHSLHISHGARMVEFASYNLPIQYRGIMAEHLHTRNSASLFDVSHMGQLIIKGKDFASLANELEKILPANISGLKYGQMRYSLLLNENAGIIDDLIITRPSLKQADDGTIFMVVNGATKQNDFHFLRNNLPPEISIEFEEDKSLIALQGPKAAKVLMAHNKEINELEFMQADKFIIDNIDVNISRSGYTGEDGFEISIKNQQAEQLANILLNHEEVELAGLGARDSLRLEAGLCLYGHDLTEDIDPISADLTFAIGKDRRKAGGFIGDKKLQEYLTLGTKYKRVGIIFAGKMPVREGAKIFDEAEEEIGFITSGGYSPSLKMPIAMGYILTKKAKLAEKIIAKVRNKQIIGEISKLPFIKNNYHKRGSKNV